MSEKDYTYEVLSVDGRAKRAHMETAHGVIETPVFMNVATAGAIKGGLSAADLHGIGTQVMLCNTYHLHVRTGDAAIRRMGGLHAFTRWDRPILTDSGGYQVFSLAKMRQIREEGVTFRSHVDGAYIFMGPEESMTIQSNLGSTIAMAFDECAPALADREYVEKSVSRTTRWLERSRAKMEQLKADEGCVNPHQLLFGINQGAVFHDIRVDQARRIAEMNLDGYAVGGLAVGETHEEMYAVLDDVIPEFPVNKPTYLMGVGTPANIIEAVDRGVDFFDCVYPTRNGRHGNLYTDHGTVHIMNVRYAEDLRPIDPDCGCPVCRAGYSRAYIRHLMKAQETLGLRFCVMHNLWFYNHLMQEIRDAIDAGNYAAWKRAKLDALGYRTDSAKT